MVLSAENFDEAVQEACEMNRKDINGLLKTLNTFKPQRLQLELIKKLIAISGVHVEVCPYGDIVTFHDFDHYSETYQKAKTIIEDAGYWVGLTHNLYKTMPDKTIESIGTFGKVF